MRLLITLNRADPAPVYMQIMKEVRRAIVVGVLAPDDAIPSVRDLAAQLSLNPNTIKQAYRELEREGVVYVRRGEGTFVANWGQGAATRKRIVRDMAARALKEAQQYDVDPNELVEEIERQSGGSALQRRTATRSAARRA